MQISVIGHTEETPYQCRICDEVFIPKNNLKTPMISHTGENNQKCTYCKKAFSQ